GFRAAGKKLDVGDVCRQQIADELEKAGAGLGREAAEGCARELLADALDVVGMTVADAADCYAGNEIEIFIAVDVVNRATPSAIHCDFRIKRNRLQPRRHRLGLAVEYRLRPGPRNDATLGVVLLRRRHVAGRSTFHDSTPCRDTIRTRCSKRSTR